MVIMNHRIVGGLPRANKTKIGDQCVRNNYLYKILLFLDLFISALAFRDPDVTISAETGLAMQRAKPPLWAKLLNGFLNLIQKDHCHLAIQDDIERAQTAIEYLRTPQV
jgi:hypothetical protein